MRPKPLSGRFDDEVRDGRNRRLNETRRPSKASAGTAARRPICSPTGCPQRMLLPNDRAIEPQSREAYERFGLNERQIELVSRATPKRHYYLQSARGNRLFELGLGPVALALCGTSDPATQARIDAIIAEHGLANFAARFLNDVGFEWAGELLAEHPE